MNPEKPLPGTPDPGKDAAHAGSESVWTLERRLYEGEEICAFDFFQSIRLLSLLGAKDRVPIGLDGPPESEIVRFRSHISLSFPASAIQELVKSGTREPALMTVNFLGLTGPSGILPRHYTERLLTEVKGDGKSALRDWFDLFNHRVLALFYRAWEKYRFYLPFECNEDSQRELDPFSRCLYSLIGLGFRSQRNRFCLTWSESETRSARRETQADARSAPGAPRSTPLRELARLDDSAFLRFAGLFAHRPRSAVSLEAFLRVYLQLPVKIQQFQGQWLELDRDSQTGLGTCNAQLGLDALVGDRVWDVQSKVRICLGPLTYEQFLELLPDRKPTPERKRIFLLAQVVRWYLGAEMDIEFQLALRKDQVPPVQAGPQSRLGWNTWSRTQPYPRHAGDTVFTVTDGSRL